METKVDLKLRPVVETEDLLNFASRIREDFPHSMTMYNILLMKARGHIRDFSYEFYTLEDHPDSHVIISIQRPDNISLHCRETEVPLGMKALEDAQVLPLQEKVVKLFHIPEYLVAPCEKLMRTRYDSSRVFTGPHHTLSYEVIQDYPLRCPVGMQIRRLGRTGVQHLIQMSKYNKHEDLESMCHFTANMPALGIYLNPTLLEETTLDMTTIDFAAAEDTPIAWVCWYPYGPVGMLSTSEEFRGRGLGPLLTEAIARMKLSDDYVPHAHVDISNASSLGMFRKLPGWRVSHQATWIFYKEDS